MTHFIITGRRLRRSLISILAALLIAAFAFAAAPTPAQAAADDDIVITGSGWGHGVGMSQYGAYAMAVNGKSYSEILGHFYQGTSIGTLGQGGLSAPPPIWVNLKNAFSTTTLRVIGLPGMPASPATITRGGTSWQAPVGTRIEVRGPTECSLVIDRPNQAPVETAKGGCAFDIKWYDWQSAASPNVGIAVEGCSHYGVECKYARGMLHVRPGLTGLDLSARMVLDDYVLGIAEMPYSWGTNGLAALEAQAVAARSYARELQIYRGAPNPHENPTNSCAAWCHVRDTVWDQFYIGWGHGDSLWIKAVNNTRTQVVTHPDAPNNNVVRAYYSSSSGGKTENIHEVWPGWDARSYYQGVPDPWVDNPSINPNSSWTERLSNASVAGKVGLDAVANVQVTSRNSSGSASMVTFTGPGGETVTQSAAWMRTTFGLRSVYFNIKISGRASTPRIGPFVDIANSVHADDIVAVYKRGVTKGCNPPANDRYCPNDNVTRGQMAAFLVRAFDLPPAGEDRFDDDNSSVFEDDINRLAASGITAGCAERRFCPDSQVTRDQMAAFLDRAFELPDAGADYFGDVNGSTFEGNINRIAAAGITLGCNPPANDRYCPKDPVARGQMASFLERALTGAGK